MKRIIRVLILAVALVTGLTTVSAQTVQVLVTQKVASLPSTASNYLDDPFRYFNIQLVVAGAGADGLDVFFDMDFSINDDSFYLRTRPGSAPKHPLHVYEGVNLMKKDVMQEQLRGRKESNVDLSHPLNAQQLPEGTYQLCLDVYLWSDKDNPNRVPISMGPCPTYDICYSGSAPELVSPMAGAQIALNGAMVVTPVRKVNFFWSPVISNCASNNTRFKYQLKVVKVLNGQNYRDAIKYNPVIFSTEVRDKTFAVFDTLRDIKVQMERGELYVAQVQAEPIKTNRSMESFVVANDGNSQPMPFYWDFPDNLNDPRLYNAFADDEDEDGDGGKGISGLTEWEGGVEEVSELETIEEEMVEQDIVGFSSKRHYVESDGYYTIPMSNDLEVLFTPAQHKSIKNASYSIELYDYIDDDIDTITAYEPLFSEEIGEVSDELVDRTLVGWGSELEQGNLYYLQLLRSYTVGYWKYSIADTTFYVNEMLAEHIHDTISREYVEEAFEYADGVFFQWGDDPEVPDFTTPQWKSPVNRSGDDIYDPANYVLPTSVPEVQKAKTFPVSWTPVKNVTSGDEVEYEVNVYELKPGQTLDEALSENEVLVSRTVTDVNEISETDTKFFKAFSAKKTYVMTLSTTVSGDSETIYHFANGNEALPIVFKIVK